MNTLDLTDAAALLHIKIEANQSAKNWERQPVQMVLAA